MVLMRDSTIVSYFSSEYDIILNIPDVPDDSWEIKKTAVYQYMWRSFQFVEPNDGSNYESNSNFKLCKDMRCIVLLTTWCCAAFELYNFIIGFDQFVTDVNIYKIIVTVLHRIIFIFRYILLQNVGVYVFYNSPLHFEHLLEQVKKERLSSWRWNKAKKLCTKLMVLSLVLLVFLPVIQKVIPLIIEYRLRLPRKWDERVVCAEFVVLIFSRFVAMPILFYLILIIELHCGDIERFKTDLQGSKQQVNKLFSEY